MAKKLSKEELAKTKLPDFDPPVDPGQTELFGTQKVSKKKKPAPKKAAAPAPQERHAGGRPKKGNETTRVVSFRLPERTVRRLRVRAALDGVSSADVIVDLVDKINVPGID